MDSVGEREDDPAPLPPDLAANTYVEQIESLAQQVEQLTAAVESNRIVGAAIGIVIERLSLDRRAAFIYLVHRSQQSNTKLSTVAQERLAKVERNARAGGGSAVRGPVG